MRCTAAGSSAGGSTRCCPRKKGPRGRGARGPRAREASPRWGRVPLINRVAAGVPVEHTDLGFPGGPGGAADEYLPVPDVGDPDAFATRIVGASMEPRYVEGDVVVCSPRAKVEDGCDCFVRLEPDHESTFKRVYFDGEAAASGASGASGTSGASEASRRGRVRLQPLNPAFAARVVEREAVSGMYRAVWKFSRV